MLDAIRHFATETSAAFLALALIGGGIALLASPQATIAERIPLLGSLIARIRTAAATVLISAGVGVLGFLAGYLHRGTLDKSASYLETIQQQDEQISELNRQASAAGAIADAARVRADAAERAHADRQVEIDRYAEELARRPAEGRCALTDDDVRWLRTRPRATGVPAKPTARSR